MVSLLFALNHQDPVTCVFTPILHSRTFIIWESCNFKGYCCTCSSTYNNLYCGSIDVEFISLAMTLFSKDFKDCLRYMLWNVNILFQACPWRGRTLLLWVSAVVYITRVFLVHLVSELSFTFCSLTTSILLCRFLRLWIWPMSFECQR